MNQFLQTARPILFETSFEESSEESYYWGRGTSFLAHHRDQYYFITARHVLDNQDASQNLLRIFPTDESTYTVPFNQQYLLNPEGGDEKEEYHDVFILRIDVPMQVRTSNTSLYAINLDNSLLSPEALSIDQKLAVIGFPSDARAIDYDDLKIKYRRSAMSALFKGRSKSDYCYIIKFTDTQGHHCIDGMSGAPVFSFDYCKEGTIPRFVGMMLRGSGESKVGNFVSSLVFTKALSEIDK